MKTKNYALLALLCVLLNVQTQAQQITLVKELGETPGWTVNDAFQFQGYQFFITNTQDRTSLYRIEHTGEISLVYSWTTPFLEGSKFRPVFYHNRFYFAANDVVHGLELWVSDGTYSGTHIVTDLFKGPTDGLFSTISPPVVYNDLLYFVGADRDAKTPEGWSSDGTESGTKKILKVDKLGSFGGGIMSFFTVNSKLIYSGVIDSGNYGLYRFNPETQQGTEFAHGIVTIDPVQIGNIVYLRYNSYNPPLLSTDGTTTGTFWVDSPINFGFNYVFYHSKVYFVNNHVFKVNDGTKKGSDTIMKVNDFPGFGMGTAIVYNDKIYATGYSSLFESDGTSSGTKELVTDLESPNGLIIFGNKFYFKASDSSRIELFESQGTKTSTRKVYNPGANSTTTSNNFGVISDPSFVYQNELYFTAIYDQAKGKALYKLTLADGPNTYIGLMISPNPVSQIATMTYPANSNNQLMIMDALGRIVMSKEISTSGMDILDCNGLGSGNYFVKISGTSPTLSSKLMVCH